MSKYFFRYHADTFFSLGNRIQHASGNHAMWRLDFPDRNVVVYETTKEVSGIKIFSGLRMDFYINSSDPDVALLMSSGLAYTIFNLLGFSAVASWKDVRLEMQYLADKGIIRRESKAYFYPAERAASPIYNPIRILDRKIFNDIFVTFFDAPEDVQIAVNKAIHQLNKGFTSDDFDDKFIDYWTGITYLAGKLNTKFDSHKEETLPNCRSCKATFATCPKCGDPFATKKVKSDFAGVKQVVTSLGWKSKEFDVFYKIRSVLLKSGNKREIPGYINKIPKLRTLLIACICKLLTLPQKSEDLLMGMEPFETGLFSREYRTVHVADILDFPEPPDIQDIDAQPAVSLENGQPAPKLNGDGTITISGNLKFGYRISGNARFAVTEVQQWGHDMPGLKSASLGIVDEK